MIRCKLRPSARGLALAVVAGATGCFATAPEQLGECTPDGRACNAGQVCVDQQCLTVCARSADCGAGEACVATVCRPFAGGCAAGESCPEGWRCDGVACQKLTDACVPGGDDCTANASCLPFGGETYCVCDSGYTGDGTECADLDECAAGLADCRPTSVCRNSAGSFACDCLAGSVPEPDGKGCASGWSDAAAGGQHACAVALDGSLWCWGRNSEGQLGTGEARATNRPARVGDESDWERVAAGGRHSCALAEGALWCWGENGAGQLGLGHTEEARVPQAVGGAWLRVATGGAHTCAIDTGDRLRCWGENASGQLGLGPMAPAFSSTPQPVGARADWAEVTCGDEHTCARTSGGELFCWGRNHAGQLGDGSLVQRASPVAVAGANWRQLAAGQSHTCALDAGGQLYCWGSNADGQLGLIGPEERPSPTSLGVVATWTSVAVGDTHTCATRAGGALWCWGGNAAGQLARPPSSGGSTMVQVTGLGASATVVAGAQVTCALSSAGALNCFGENTSGQLGRGAGGLQPGAAIGAARFVGLGAGAAHTCAVGVDHALRCWGNNATGQLGLAPLGGSRAEPVLLPLGADWRAVAAGDGHTCGVRDSGTLWCWGDGARGQLGRGAAGAATATAAQVGAQGDWLRLTLGGEHTCGVRAAPTSEVGSLWCWGDNRAGQLGLDSAEELIATPTQVGVGEMTWRQVAAGAAHTCGLRADATLWCWGDDTFGQLGLGTGGPGASRSAPAQLTGGGYRDVACGEQLSCALGGAGELLCWGELTGLWSSATPRAVGTGSWSAVRVGRAPGAVEEQVCAVRASGEVACWGSNLGGELGDGTTLVSATPTPVWQAPPLAGLTAGGGHACALDGEGLAWCWGRDDAGQRGDGDGATPALVIPR